MRQDKRNSRDLGPRELVALDVLEGIPNSAARAALKAFVAFRGDDESLPTKREVRLYLELLTNEKGRACGCTEFSWLQFAAAHVWGTAETACFATVSIGTQC